MKEIKGNKILLAIGSAIALTGIVFIVIGFWSFFSSFGKGMPKYFWCCFVGFPLFAVGQIMIMYNLRGKFASHFAKTNAPIIEATVAAAKKAEAGRKCPECGTVCSVNDKFCSSCGATLVEVCSSCGSTLDSDAKYCSSCGKRQ